MASNTLFLKNSRSGQLREAPVGFSWTVLFFGVFPPLFRSDFKWALIMFFAAIFSFGFSVLVFPFLYNKLYVKDLLKNGFHAKSAKQGTMEHMAFKLGVPVEVLESKRLPLALPPVDEQERILSALSKETLPLATAISRLEREIELLREYRTRLVADVVTGKLDVREAAARLPDEAPVEPIEDDTDLGDETEAADEEAAV